MFLAAADTSPFGASNIGNKVFASCRCKKTGMRRFFRFKHGTMAAWPQRPILFF